MSFGAILIGIAAIIITLAHIARPFRHDVDPDAIVETWVAQHGRLAQRRPVQGRLASRPYDDAFCSQCGRKIVPDHHFCPGCGHKLEREETET